MFFSNIIIPQISPIKGRQNFRTIKIASEIGAQMKLRFVTLMLHMLNFGKNSVERSRSAVAMGIQSIDKVKY